MFRQKLYLSIIICLTILLVLFLVDQLGKASDSGGSIAASPLISACDSDPCVQAAPGGWDERTAVKAVPAITLTEIISGLEYPTDIANAGDGRLFIVEKPGRIRIFDGSSLLPNAYLDISTLVSGGTTLNGERGLLGLAFHPDYANNGYFYVNYTFDPSGPGLERSRVARYTVSAANPNLADPASAKTILEIEQDFSNHNGGDLNFGPDDGYLYIGLGDGGSGGDPNDRAQDNSQLLGKILRIDVDGAGGADCDVSAFSNYAIPADNPFAGVAGCDEIWSSGLRHPWRFSFDRLRADMWIGDVGQGSWEEIDFQPANSSGGENWGWRCYEGNAEYNLSGCGAKSSYDFPLHVYPIHSSMGNCAVTGGFVYRGTNVPQLKGHYIFADYCSNHFWSIGTGSRSQLISYGLPDVPGSSFSGPTTFGEDMSGELYVAENGESASIFKISAVACANCDQSQAISLSSGWNMRSSHIDPHDPALESVMGDVQSQLVLMKNDLGQVYWPAQGINTIEDFDVYDGYQIMMDSGQTVILGGLKIDPAQSPLNLLPGWQLIAYLRDNSMPIQPALDSISAELKLAKNGTGQVYWPAYNVNQIGDMVPGEGYQVYMDSSGTLVYPAN